MSEIEISLTHAYLRASGQDPVAALIRSVKDLARSLQILAQCSVVEGAAEATALPRHPATGPGTITSMGAGA